MKKTIDITRSYKKWMFKPDNNFTEFASNKGDDKHKGINVESVKVKWYYNSETQILKIDRDISFTEYKLDNFENKTIKLIKLKKEN